MRPYPSTPEAIEQQLVNAGRANWVEALSTPLREVLVERPHGHWQGWCEALGKLPRREGATLSAKPDRVGVAARQPLSGSDRERLLSVLDALRPWRKGPFDLFGLALDAEWRCDQKWARLSDAIEPLSGRRVLDVGSGNGWFSWQMRACGAREVVAVDPTLLFLAQFLVMQHYVGDPDVHFLPLPLEALPEPQPAFDTVFSMGVLYHRRSPLEHLEQLRNQLRPGGELVLETLVIEGDANQVLVPPGRYARMRNVWFLPSVAMLTRWLERLGFDRVRLIDVSATRPTEQRVTPWSSGQSLADFLDADNPERTVEGHPAPLRATLVANR